MENRSDIRSRLLEMLVLDVEAARRQVLEHRLYLSFIAIYVKGGFRFAVRHGNLHFRFAFFVPDNLTGKITWLIVHIIDTIQMFAFTISQVIEEPESLGLGSVSAYPDVSACPCRP
jgi:hypothetical protein